MLKNICINDKHYALNNDVRTNHKMRNSFNALAQKTFGIDFEIWYQNGYWGERYIPYVLIDDTGEVVANVSANVMDMRLDGEQKHFIQIGTVMTEENCRNQGLSRVLMEHILCEWRDKCDGIYLFGGNDVLDFYPKFGFTAVHEYECAIKISNCKANFRKLDMDSEADKEILHQHYRKDNPFSRFSMTENWGLLMFYCDGHLRGNIYYSQSKDLVFVGKRNGSTMHVHDVFGECSDDVDDVQAIQTVLQDMLPKEIEQVSLGFSPKASLPVVQKNKENHTLFVSDNMKAIFTENKLIFPTLSHA